MELENRHVERVVIFYDARVDTQANQWAVQPMFASFIRSIKDFAVFTFWKKGLLNG